MCDVSHDVFRSSDSNADSVPDTMHTKPFVRGTWSPYSTSPIVHVYRDPATQQTTDFPGGVSAIADKLVDPTLRSVTLLASALIGRLSDSDANGIADVFDDPAS